MSSGGVEPVLMDDPNRQSVGLDPAWVEGSGGSSNLEPPPDESGGEIPPGTPLDSMTKDELLAYAGDHGVAVSTAMTKAEIVAEIEAAGA